MALNPELSLLHDALSRIVARAPASGQLAVLLLGGSRASEKLRESLASALGADKRIVLVSSSIAPAAPMPDANTPGGHVNAVAQSFTPRRPDLIVNVSESGGTLWIAAHTNVADPLGGPGNAGWLFALSTKDAK